MVLNEIMITSRGKLHCESSPNITLQCNVFCSSMLNRIVQGKSCKRDPVSRSTKAGHVFTFFNEFAAMKFISVERLFRVKLDRYNLHRCNYLGSYVKSIKIFRTFLLLLVNKLPLFEIVKIAVKTGKQTEINKQKF